MQSANLASAADDFPRLGHTRPVWTLLLVSGLGLFLELMLIRWIGTEVRIFAYLQNTVLVVCFLGLGMGCFTCRRPIVWYHLLIPLFVLVACFALPPVRAGLKSITVMLGQAPDFVMWMQSVSVQSVRAAVLQAAGVGLTLLLMTLVWLMFVPIGRLLGRLMDDHPRTIRAYSINVAGGLLGIWGFVLLSVFYQPPLMWIALTALLALPLLLGSARRRVYVGLLIGTVALSFFAGLEQGAREVYWSPYQKLVLRTAADGQARRALERYVLTVNSTGYQGLLDLSDSAAGGARTSRCAATASTIFPRGCIRTPGRC
ncbi:MAG TPA: hypothetical protein PKK06_01015 [Phycisphaerae bacterium]|nr:hypothetical protein [Phycisphaerae bacterium]HNU43812.1 hypothetical protein [Phycisphaerae bacterium]